MQDSSLAVDERQGTEIPYNALVDLSMVHLHVHTPGSLLDGFCRIDELIALAKEYGMTALGVSDHGVCHSHIEFYQKCLKAGIKPILGMEAYVTPNRFMKKAEYDLNPELWEDRPKLNHLLLIARTNEGYENLLHLTSVGWLEGFYRKPRIDYELIQQYGKGIIATSACLGSDISQYILKGDHEMAKGMIRFYAQCFDEFYLEVQPSTMPEQIIVNNTLIEWSKEMNLPLVATSDAHMLKKEELPIHAAFTTIGKQEDENDISVYEHCYFMDAKEMLSFNIPSEAIANTQKIADKCKVTLDLGNVKLPKFDVPDGYSYDTYLSKLTNEALFDLALRKDIDIVEYQERLFYELEVIQKKGIAGYMLIVWDYIKFARERDILVGPGRGSGAGSLICYLLKITNLDPIQYKLLFQRFINPDRPGFPDIDSDFDYLRRHEVIDYVTEKYGALQVAQIGTFTTLSTKAAFKDVARGLDIDHTLINEMNKLIPVSQGKVASIDEALEQVPQLREWEERYPKLFELGRQVANLPRSSSIHACGILIAPEEISRSVPLSRGKNGERVTQYEGPVLEEIGFLKFDFLGLKNLSVIEIARRLVEKRHGVLIEVDELEPNDEKVFETIQRGNTLGIFQLESEGMQKLFQGLNKVDFESMIAGVSLYRPGPMAHIPDYQARANGYTPVTYFHPDAENVMKDTFGIMIYQEQLMQLAGEFGGYTAGEQDGLRKATGKKSQEVMDKVLPELKTRILEKGYTEDIANQIVKLIEPFVGYGLRKYSEAC